MRLDVQPETYPQTRAFMLSRGAKMEAGVVTVTAEAGGFRGRGESVRYHRRRETRKSVIDQIAPAFLAAQGAEIVDRNGPLLISRDRTHTPLCDGAVVHPANPELRG